MRTRRQTSYVFVVDVSDFFGVPMVMRPILLPGLRRRMRVICLLISYSLRTVSGISIKAELSADVTRF